MCRAGSVKPQVLRGNQSRQGWATRPPAQGDGVMGGVGAGTGVGSAEGKGDPEATPWLGCSAARGQDPSGTPGTEAAGMLSCGHLSPAGFGVEVLSGSCQPSLGAGALWEEWTPPTPLRPHWRPRWTGARAHSRGPDPSPQQKALPVSTRMLTLGPLSSQH